MTHTDKNNVLVLGMDLYIIIIIFNTDVPIQSDIFKETYKKKGREKQMGMAFYSLLHGGTENCSPLGEKLLSRVALCSPSILGCSEGWSITNVMCSTRSF